MSRSVFDPLPGELPKGPTIAGKLPIGGSKFTPWVNLCNYKARVGKEMTEAMRPISDNPLITPINEPLELYRTQRLASTMQSSAWPDPSPRDPVAIGATMRSHLQDPVVRRLVRNARRRAREIDSGSPLSPVPRTPLGEMSFRAKLIGATTPYLNEAELDGLSEFIQTRAVPGTPLLSNRSRSSTPGAGVGMPRRAPAILSRPNTQMSLSSRRGGRSSRGHY